MPICIDTQQLFAMTTSVVKHSEGLLSGSFDVHVYCFIFIQTDISAMTHQFKGRDGIR